jgi:hypothetical protein
MVAPDAACLDALASCLGSGVPLPDALARIESAGMEASRWVGRIRKHSAPDGRAPVSLEDALCSSNVVDAAERAVLARAVTPAEVEGVLRAFALRRGQRAALRRALLRGLVGPLAVAILTVVLDPLPNLLGNGSYVGPVLSGLFVLGLVSAACVVGVPAALRSPALGPRFLALSAKLPGLAWLAAQHAEAELVTMSAPFAAPSDAGSGGLLAMAAALSWSPLGGAIRGAVQSGGAASAEAPLDWALVRLAPRLSLPTNLSIVSGIASGQLAARLTARGDEIATRLTARLRFATRTLAYSVVVLLSIQSLVGMVSRAMPGGSLLPGIVPSAEQKELEEIMKELEGPAPAKPPK